MRRYVSLKSLPFSHGFRLLFLALFTTLVLTFCLGAGVHAQDPLQSQCYGLDLVLIVDQSWSMAVNDVYRGREAAVAYVIDRLGDNAVYYCSGVQHRLAVIGFGEETSTTPAYKDYIAETIIAPTPETVEIWESERETLKAKYEVEFLGNTDFLPPLLHASSILEGWRERPPQGDQSVRRQAVILVTDGGPCKTTEGCKGNPGEWEALPKYLDLLRENLRPEGDVMPYRGATGIYFFVVAFQDSSLPEYDYLADPTVRGLWEQVTEQHGGRLVVLNKSREGRFDNVDLSVKLTEALDALLGSALIRNRCGEPIYVEAYLDTLLIHVFKVGAETGKEIDQVMIRVAHDRKDGSQDIYLDGKALQGDAGVIRDYTEQGPNERYVIGRPAPGKWWVTAEGADLCKHVDVRYQVANLDHYPLSPRDGEELAQIDEPPYYDPENPQLFIYAIKERITGAPLAEQEGFPIHAVLVVQPPSGQKQEFLLQRTATGAWASAEPLVLREVGEHRWTLRVTTPSVREDAKEPYLILSDAGSFQVNAVQRFGFEILEPQQGAKYPVNWLLGASSKPVPVTVTLGLVDAAGSPLPPSQVQTVFLDPLDQVFEAQITGPQGEKMEARNLAYDPQRNVFTAVLRSAEHLSNEIDTPGTYTVEVLLEGRHRKAQWHPRHKTGKVSITREQVRPITFSVEAGQDEEGIARFPLYCGRIACVGAQVAPVTFKVLVRHADQPTVLLAPSEVAREDPEEVFRAFLLTPSREFITITLRPQTEPEGPVWVGKAGENLAEAGEYTLSVEPVLSALAPVYQLVDPSPAKLKVLREDHWLTRPSTCRATYGGLATLAVLFLAFMIWNVRTRPTGIITFRDRRTGVVLHQEVLAKGWRGLWHTYRAKGGGLDALDISKLEAKRARPPEGVSKAIDLKLFDKDGGCFVDESGVGSGESFDLDRDVVVRYD
ncbi:MAG: hypothetical protein ACUVXH_12080 [Anaerolineae bacterium]